MKDWQYQLDVLRKYTYKYDIYYLICSYKKRKKIFDLTNLQIANKIGANNQNKNRSCIRLISSELTELEKRGLIKRIFEDDNFHKERIDIIILDEFHNEKTDF